MASPPANTGAMPATTSRTTSPVVAPSARRTANVAQPLLHGEADDPEDADHRQRERQPGEGDDEHGAEPVPLGRRPGDVVERLDVAHADELIAIDAADRPRERPASAARRRPRRGRTTR